MKRPIEETVLLPWLAYQKGLVSKTDLLNSAAENDRDSSKSILDLLRGINPEGIDSLARDYQRGELGSPPLLSGLLETDWPLSGDNLTNQLRKLLDSTGDETIVGPASSIPPGHPYGEESGLARAIARLKGTPPDQGNFDNKVVHPESPVRSRYEILRPHASGGLGEVFLARDLELPREVALKQMKPGSSDFPKIREQFVLEAEVTGGLEHPGIVPVYGLGRYPDGRPYYAMRFIRGGSLKEAIQKFHSMEEGAEREKNLAFRDLLNRFIDICQAMQYAHDRGVIHRDLKPGNIMLGEYGETLVVDWGLAKVLGGEDVSLSTVQGVEKTGSGSPIGTPAYMSPEQAAGQHDQVGRASDVYSLGATLYALLTGKTPFVDSGNPRETTSIELSEILRRVKAGEISSPREQAEWIAPSLEAICLKAMSIKPKDRYPDPRSLAKDLENYLADEPVSAWPEPWFVRAGRWARKHRTLVTGVTAASIVLLISASIVAAIQSHNNKVLSEANKKLDQANGELSTTNLLLEQTNDTLDKTNQDLELANQAEREATSAANDRFLMALESYETLILKVQNQLENRPGMRPLQTALLKTGAEGLEKLRSKAASSKRADLVTAIAFSRMGELNLGPLLDLNQGKSLFQESLRILREFLKQNPDDSQGRRWLAFTMERLGDLDAMKGDNKAALDWHGQSLEIRVRLQQAYPSNSQLVRDLAIGLTKKATSELRLGQTKEAIPLLEDAKKWNGQLLASEPESKLYLEDQGIVLERLGDLKIQLGGTEEAKNLFNQSLELRRRLLALDPESPISKRNLALGLSKLGSVHLKAQKIETADPLFTEALTQTQSLSTSEPGNALYLRDLIVCHYNLGECDLVLDKYPDAIAHYQAGLDVFQAMLKENLIKPTNPLKAVLEERIKNCQEAMGRNTNS